MDDFEAKESFGNLRYFETGLYLAGLDIGNDRDPARDLTRDFTATVERLTEESGLRHHIDDAISGHPSPRVWMFLDEPGGTLANAVAAISAARTLSDRGQTVVVLDGDDGACELTRWAGRFELDGWIDMARYGASLLASSVDLPFPGKKAYLVGVGSFSPTHATPAEISELLQRLRRQADDLLIVAATDAAGLAWSRHADIRLLCWDRATRGREAVATLIADLESNDCAPTGLIGFADLEAAVVEQKLSPLHETPDTVQEAVRDEQPTAKTADVLEPRTEMPVDHEESISTGISVSAPFTGGEDAAADLATTDRDEVAEYPSLAWQNENKPRRSSPLFVAFAAVLFIVAIGLGGYWYVVLREPAGGFRSDTLSVATMNEGDVVTPPGAGETPHEAPGFQPGGERDSSRPVADEAADGQAAAIPDDEAGQTGETDAGTVVDALAGESDQPPPLLDMEPFSGPVGEGGWALHLYSFPDSSLAQAEVRSLERRGFRAVFRAFEMPEKGRWYRVYVGSFPDRRSAQASVPAVKARLSAEWAMPKPF